MPEVLTRKVGPFPVWGWGVIGSGVLAAGILLGRRGRAQVPATAQETIGAGMAAPDYVGGSGGGSGGGVGGPYGPENLIPTAPTIGPRSQPTGTGQPDETPRRDYVFAPDVDETAIGPGARVRGGGLTAAGQVKAAAALTNMIADNLDRGSPIVSGTAGNKATMEATVANLTKRGYTAGIASGQVYAAKDSATYFNRIPAADRANLARLLVALDRNKRAA